MVGVAWLYEAFTMTAGEFKFNGTRPKDARASGHMATCNHIYNMMQAEGREKHDDDDNDDTDNVTDHDDDDDCSAGEGSKRKRQCLQLSQCASMCICISSIFGRAAEIAQEERCAITGNKVESIYDGMVIAIMHDNDDDVWLFDNGKTCVCGWARRRQQPCTTRYHISVYR